MPPSIGDVRNKDRSADFIADDQHSTNYQIKNRLISLGDFLFFSGQLV
jgi:hypothetical protein